MITNIKRNKYPPRPIGYCMNSIDLLDALRKYPVFDTAQFASITGLDSASAKVRLFRMREQGRLLGIQRNSFTVYKDPLVIASKIVWPSYISLWYALSHHGLTLQVPQGITVLTSRQTFRKKICFQGTSINFLLVSPSFMYGYDRIDVGGHEVFMAYPEKALLDALHLQQISVSEISEILMEHGRELDLDRLVEYALRSKDDKLVRRTGLLLERSGYRQHKGLPGGKGKAPIPLDPLLPAEGPLNRKWAVLDNLGAVK